MKIVIVRGPSLNLWEMQNFLPLAKKHKLLLVGSKGGKYQFGDEVQGEKLTCLGEIFSFIPGAIKLLYYLFGDPQVILGLEKAISGFDIVHTAELANYYSLQAVRARQKGLVGKVVVTCWENIAGAREDYPAQKRLKEKVSKGADHFLAVTEQARESLIEAGVEKNKITVIPMGVDLKKFKIKNEKLKIREGKIKKILFVGRIVKEKGVYELFGAAKRLLKENENIRFILVGQGPEERNLREMAVGAGIKDNFVFLGSVSYQKMPEIFASADIFVLPSKPIPTWQEQFGMVLVEAMTSGLPIVSTKTGAIPEVVGEAGILVEPGKSNELAEAIKRLLKDGKLRESLAAKGLVRAQESHDCQKVALKIEKLYQNVLKD